MKEGEGFLGDVSAAEPLVGATLRGGPKLLDEFEADIVEAAVTIGEEVEAELADVNANDPTKEGRVE